MNKSKSYNIYNDIITIKDKCKINNKSQVLYNDNIKLMDKQFTDQLLLQCQIFYPNNSNNILRGLSFNDFDNIECIVDNKQFIPLNININESSLNINTKIYYDLTKEIINMNINDSINSLPIIKYINNNLQTYENEFVKFSQSFRQIIIYMRNQDMWITTQKLSELIEFERTDGYLLCRYAKCLSYLKHIRAADYYFNCGINECEYKPLISLLIGYGYHLLSTKNYYYKAYVMFNKCIKIGCNGNCKLFVGLARSLQYLNKDKQSEQWYLRANESEKDNINGFYDKAHIHYAEFLIYRNRFNAAINLIPSTQKPQKPSFR